MFTKPSNLIASVVLPNPLVGDPTLIKGILAFAGLPAGFPYKKIEGYKKTVYSAGVAQINAPDFALVTVADATMYSLTMAKNSPIGDRIKHYIIFTPSAGTTNISIRTQFVNAINADESRFVTASAVGTTLVLTEILAKEAQGFVLTDLPTGVTNPAPSTPHTEDSGTLAEVQIYDSTVSSGTYSKFEFDVLNDSNSAGNSGKSGYLVKVIVWANTLGATYAAFLDTLENAGAGILTGKDTVSKYLAVA